MYRFNAIPIKVPMTYFTDIKQILQNIYGSIQILKIYTEPEITPYSHSNFEKEEQSRSTIQTDIRTIPDINLYYKATVFKTAWY